MSKPMVVRLIVWNLAIIVALLYRWKTGSSVEMLVIFGIAAFLLVNVLIFVAAKFSKR